MRFHTHVHLDQGYREAIHLWARCHGVRSEGQNDAFPMEKSSAQRSWHLGSSARSLQNQGRTATVAVLISKDRAMISLLQPHVPSVALDCAGDIAVRAYRNS